MKFLPLVLGILALFSVGYYGFQILSAPKFPPASSVPARFIQASEESIDAVLTRLKKLDDLPVSVRAMIPKKDLGRKTLFFSDP